MSKHHLGFLPSGGMEAPTVLDNISERDAARVPTQPSQGAPGAGAATDRDQLERDIAAIERASAALRRAEPALQSWTDAPSTAVQNPRPVWLLIGVLWLSTALVTIGAVFAISVFVG